MHPFWDAVVRPLLDAAGARTVVEIGAERGYTTARLLDWAAGVDATVHVIEPAPRFDVARWELEQGERLRVHRARSVEALGGITGLDAALIDGDHNWYTVRSELRLLAATAESEGRPLPLVIAHDAGWPYGRRDMSYDPRSIPEAGRHDAARAGIAPGRSELGSPGINEWLWNATREGGARNGVRTAIEDFAAEHPGGCELVVIEGLHGLAVLASRARIEAAPAVAPELKRLRSAEFLREWIALLERARIGAEMRAREAQVARAHAERRASGLEQRLLDEPVPPADDDTLAH